MRPVGEGGGGRGRGGGGGGDEVVGSIDGPHEALGWAMYFTPSEIRQWKRTGYRRTDGRTDTPAYRDAWTHLKSEISFKMVSDFSDSREMLVRVTICHSQNKPSMFHDMNEVK